MAKKLLSGVGFVFWGCPYFGTDNDYDGKRHEELSKFFNSILDACLQLHQAPPKVGIAIDCKGHDCEFNVYGRFGSDQHANWEIKRIVDMQGYYEFSASRSRQLFAEIYSGLVDMLVYEYHSPMGYGAQPKLTDTVLFFPNRYKRSPFITHQEKNPNPNKMVILHPLSKIPKSHITDLFAGGRFRGNDDKYLSQHCFPPDRSYLQYQNCFSVPTARYPYSETEIVRKVEAYLHFLDRDLIGRDSRWKLTEEDIGYMSSRAYAIIRGGARPCTYLLMINSITSSINDIALLKGTTIFWPGDDPTDLFHNIGIEFLIYDIAKHNIATLDLSNIGCGDTEVVELAKQLFEFTPKNLIFINLAKNNITDTGFSAIMQILPKLPNIQKVNFTGNYISRHTIITELDQYSKKCNTVNLRSIKSILTSTAMSIFKQDENTSGDRTVNTDNLMQIR